MALNSVTLVGYLGGNAEIKDLANGNKVAILNLAVDNSYKDSNGEYVKRTSWIKCITYRPNFAESLAKHASKGTFVGVEGKLVTRTYEDKDGKTVGIAEIEMNHLEYLHRQSKDSAEEEAETAE